MSFVFIAPSYNVSKTCRQAILSLAAQSFKDWKLIVVDDMSNDSTEEDVKSLFQKLDLFDNLIFVKNKTKLWEVANVLQALKLCKPEDIVCRFDLDDYLIDNQTLDIINHFYESDKDLEALWTSHRWHDQNGITTMNISASMPADADPYKHQWVSSHLKTFRKKLVDQIPYENFLNMHGDLVKRAGDQCLYLPILQKAKKRIHIPLVSYAYKCDMSPETFQTEDAKFQKAEADFLRNRGFVKDGTSWEEETKDLIPNVS